MALAACAHDEGLAFIEVDALEIHAERGVAREGDGGVARQQVDLAGLEDGPALLHRCRGELHLGGIAQHGGGHRLAEVDVDAGPFALVVGEREAGQAEMHAAFDVAAGLDGVQCRAWREGLGLSGQGWCQEPGQGQGKSSTSHISFSGRLLGKSDDFVVWLAIPYGVKDRVPVPGAGPGVTTCCVAQMGREDPGPKRRCLNFVPKDAHQRRKWALRPLDDNRLDGWVADLPWGGALFMIKRHLLGAAAAVLAFMALSPLAQAAPVTAQPMIERHAGLDVTTVRYRGGYGGAYRGTFARPAYRGYAGRGYGYRPFVGFGIGAGIVAGAIIANNYYAPRRGYYYDTYDYSGPYYYPTDYRGDPRDICARHFRSFEWRTGLYTTYQGEKRMCPYLGS